MFNESIIISDYFVCPDCKYNVVTEIQTNMCVTSVMTDLHDINSFVEAEYSGDVAWDGGVVDRYQCYKCGYIIRHPDYQPIGDPVATLEGLLKWLEQHKAERENV